VRRKQNESKVLSVTVTVELLSYVIAPGKKYSLEMTFERRQQRWRRDRVR